MQELNRAGGYSSNLKEVIDFAVKICRNPFLFWGSGDLNSKKVFQNLLFPEGIYYNREFDLVRFLPLFSDKKSGKQKFREY